MNVFNKKELVGEKVHTARGNGVIVEVDCSYKEEGRKVLAKIAGEIYAFTEDGKERFNDVLPSLKFGHINENIEIDYGAIPWIADWSNEEQRKYCISFNHADGIAMVIHSSIGQIIGVDYMCFDDAERKSYIYNNTPAKGRENFDWDNA